MMNLLIDDVWIWNEKTIVSELKTNLRDSNFFQGLLINFCSDLAYTIDPGLFFRSLYMPVITDE